MLEKRVDCVGKVMQHFEHWRSSAVLVLTMDLLCLRCESGDQ